MGKKNAKNQACIKILQLFHDKRKGIRLTDIGDFFRVLKLEKAVASVPGHVDEDVGAGVRQESLGPRGVVRNPTRQQPDKVLHRHLKEATNYIDAK